MLFRSPPPKTVLCSNLITNFDNNAEIVNGARATFQGQAAGSNVKASDTVFMTYEFFNSKNALIHTIDAKNIAFKGYIAEDPATQSYIFKDNDTYTIKLRVNFNGTNVAGSGSGQCLKKVTIVPPCQEAKNNDVTTCLIMAKTARNETQNIDDANNTTARAGDVIIYTLSVRNSSQKSKVDNFVIKENISDILEYATIVNLNDGSLDKQNTLSWKAVDIKPGQEVSKKITFKIKDPIPQTPTAASNPNSYDMTMTNVFYGKVVNIKLPPTVIKTTEQAAKALPNTGPGEGLIISVLLTSFVGYFFARSRLMQKELELIADEFATSGG